jgi:hypothetical protein
LRDGVDEGLTEIATPPLSLGFERLLGSSMFLK